MTSFFRPVDEGLSDVLDWIDYRADASFDPLFFCVAWTCGHWIELGIVAAFAMVVALLVPW